MTDLGRGFPPVMFYGGERCGLLNPPRGDSAALMDWLMPVGAAESPPASSRLTG